MIKQKKI